MMNNVFNHVQEDQHNWKPSNMGEQVKYSFIRDNMSSFTIKKEYTVPAGKSNRNDLSMQTAENTHS